MSGIWKYKTLYTPQIDLSDQLSVSEGATPTNYLEWEGLAITIKDESKNPLGSFKDRYIAYLLSYFKSQGKKKFAISSSGNAGVALAGFASKFDLTAEIFVPNSIDDEKFEHLMAFESQNIHITKSAKARSDSYKFALENKYVNLNKVDLDIKIQGYKSIAYEISEIDFDSIFIVVSSGVSMIGLYEGLKDIQKVVPIIIVQTSKIHPIAKEFDSSFLETSTSVAKCVSDRIASNKARIIDIVNQTNGTGVVVNDEYILRAQKILKQNNINASFNSCSSFAGLIKLCEIEFSFKKPLLIFGGN